MLLFGYLPYDNVTDIEDLSLGKISGKDIETIAGLGKEEYLPKKAYSDRFYIATRDQFIDVIEGSAIIKDEEKNGSTYVASIETGDSDYSILELPYIYYPGYEVRLDGMIIENFETEKGFVGIAVGKNDNGKLEVNYVGTNLMKISLIVSSISLIIFGIYIWKKH